MKIAKRLKHGWTPTMQNKSKTHCDDCGARLWIAPHNGIYCNAVHEIDPTRKIKRDVVVSLTNKGSLVGVYYADTNGSDIIAEYIPSVADAMIKEHNEKVNY